MSTKSVPPAPEAQSRPIPELLNDLAEAIGEGNLEAQTVLGDVMEALEKHTEPVADFDALLSRLLEIISHFRLVDQYLVQSDEQFSALPVTIQSTASVLHRATADLDKLYNELDQWHANTVCRPKAPADSADAQPSGSQP